MQLLADLTGVILLSPSSRGRTWDAIRGGYGPDVSFIDGVLGQVFSQYAIDPARVAIGGFSDGASYALSLGLTNGDLFTHIIAFSPGFMVPAQLRCKPRNFITHGTHDSILPIERCSRRLVPRLKSAGYDVHYQEFNGPHIIMPHLLLKAVRWLNSKESA
jgi:predicted esterase